MNRMMKIMLLVSALFLTGQAGCSGEGERHSPKEHVNTVIAVTPWPASAGLYVAQEKGYFKDEGLDVAFHSYISGHLGLDAAISGKAHFVTVGDTPIARAVIEGKPVAVVATLCEINRAVLIVARKDRGILSPEDLRGKRIGVVVGTTADFFLNIFLTTSYIPRTEVRIVGLETEEVVNALARGEVDAVSTWFPHTLAASDRLGDKGIVQETQRKDRVVHRIITGMNELGGLVGEYALYREERPLQQFLIEHDFILRLIESLGVSHREQAQILQSIRRSVELMKGSFLKLVSNHERYGSAQDNGLIREVENRLAGRLLVWSRDVVSDASYLESLVDEQLAATQRTISFLILALIAGTTLFLTVILMGITRNITASLGRLRKGTEVIGAGNLDYRVAMPRKDEIGELSRSFDRMTEQLQAVTVSKNALQQEVEERKKAEAALRESAEKFRIVADFTYDWEYWRSPENRFLYVSPACDRVTGYSREAFIETPDLYPRIIHPEDRGRVEKHLQEDQLHRELCELEFRITCRDGRERWIAHACRPVVDDMGRMLGRRACNRDITERKRTEQNLQESRNELELRVKERTAELERRNKELEDFNYIASHDLQEPLRKIVTFVDLLLHKADLPFSDQNRDYLYRTQKSAARMQALLKFFLDYSRVAKKDTIFNKIELAKSV